MPASRKKRATTDQPRAASVPIEISVSIVAAPWRRFSQAAWWNGQPAQSTTGVASCSASHCQFSNCSGSIIEISRTGSERAAAKISRRRRSAVGSAAVASSLGRPRSAAWPRSRRCRPPRPAPRAAVRSGSKLTVARSVAKLTVASTPSSWFRLFSTRSAQEAQVMPSIGSSTRWSRSALVISFVACAHRDTSTVNSAVRTAPSCLNCR